MADFAVNRRLRKIIEEYYKISPFAFSQKYGDKGGVKTSAIIRERNGVSNKMLELIIESYPDINKNWLLTGEGEMIKNQNSSQELITARDGASATRTIIGARIPVYDMQEAFTGDDTVLVPKNFIFIPDLPRCDGAIRMYGDRMSPALKGGDIIVYRKVKNISQDPFWGHIYLLSFEVNGDEHIMVQYVRRSDEEGSVRLVSENKDYPDTVIPRDSIKAMAQIMASVRYYNMM